MKQCSVSFQLSRKRYVLSSQLGIWGNSQKTGDNTRQREGETERASRWNRDVLDLSGGFIGMQPLHVGLMCFAAL
jgi:hypothetical protein